MLKIIAPTILVNGSNSLDILSKIPSTIRSSIIEYADKFETKTIIPLLESSEYYFNKKYEEAIKEFMCNCIQILSIICSQSKVQEQSHILETLLEAYFSGLQEIKKQISEQKNEDDPMVMPLLNAIENAKSYALMSDSFNQPDYSNALLAFANIIVSVSALKMIQKSNNTIFKVKTDNLIYKCKYNNRELEEFMKNIDMQKQ
ncbi:MAG TPA: hypothetical protein VE619_07715 [Nitrososphaeraceae archaeon]|nr:hypothetical protein [Nitrososphaeraceae archaeon]